MFSILYCISILYKGSFTLIILHFASKVSVFTQRSKKKTRHLLNLNILATVKKFTLVSCCRHFWICLLLLCTLVDGNTLANKANRPNSRQNVE